MLYVGAIAAAGAQGVHFPRRQQLVLFTGDVEVQLTEVSDVMRQHSKERRKALDTLGRER